MNKNLNLTNGHQGCELEGDLQGLNSKNLSDNNTPPQENNSLEKAGANDDASNKAEADDSNQDQSPTGKAATGVESKNSKVKKNSIPLKVDYAYTTHPDLQKKQIVELSVFEKLGFLVTTPATNRPVNPAALKVKMRSMTTSHGIIIPLLVVFGADCKKQSIELKDDIKDEDLWKTIVIIDGYHRYTTAINLNETREGSEKIKLYIMLPPNDYVSIPDMLKECNSAVRPWTGCDCLTSMLIENAGKGVNFEKLEWFQELCSLMPEKAAWLWASFKDERPKSKSQILKASKNITALKAFAKHGNYTIGRTIYEALESCFVRDLLGREEIVRYFIDNYETNVKDMNLKSTDAMEKVKKFCYSIKAEDAKEILEIKGDKSVARAIKIYRKLNMLYLRYLANL